MLVFLNNGVWETEKEEKKKSRQKVLKGFSAFPIT